MSDRRGETFVLKDDGQKPIDFSTFVLGLASAALIHLGATPHPEGGPPKVDLLLARESVELLALLREKTRGNLTSDEERLLEGLLADLRFRFVEASKQ